MRQSGSSEYRMALALTIRIQEIKNLINNDKRGQVIKIVEQKNKEYGTIW